MHYFRVMGMDECLRGSRAGMTIMYIYSTFSIRLKSSERTSLYAICCPAQSIGMPLKKSVALEHRKIPFRALYLSPQCCRESLQVGCGELVSH